VVVSEPQECENRKITSGNVSMVVANIPSFPTPFVGRQDELAQISRLLADPTCRLLTLLGPGGIGKTRLAVESALLQQKNFGDGIYGVALRPLESPELIVPAVADALHLDFYPGGDAKQQLLDALCDKRLLLVMDNFEHLLDGAAVVSEMLTTALYIKIMTTSRERLNLVEEWTFDVAGLSVPPHSDEDRIDDYDAVRLFVQSAQRVQSGFHLTDAQQPAVTRICQLVGGMPLGIEMAAAWVRALSCDEIAAEIEKGIDILATTARNVSPRHRSVRAALDHSWALLTPPEQHGFKWLSVFRGTFTREAAEFVSGVSVWTLTALVDKSLVRVDNEGRYQMQELLRQYAEEQLEQSAEADSARDRHAAYYAKFLHQRWDILRSHQQRQALDAIEAELDNIRAAWHILCKQRNVAALHDAAPSLWLAYDLRCRFQEMEMLFREGVEALRSIEPTTEVKRTLGLFLALQGWPHVGIGLPAKGQQLSREAVAFLQEVGADDSEEMLLALLSLQLTTNYLNDSKATRRVGERVIEVARRTGSAWGLARASYELGNFSLSEAENPDISEAERQALSEEAKGVAEECLRLAEACGDLWLRASVSGFFLGNVYHTSGNFAEASRRYEQSLPLFEAVGQSWAVGAVHRLLGIVLHHQNDDVAALKHFITSLEIFHRNGQIHEQITTLHNVGELFNVRGDKTRGVQLLAFIAQHPVTLEFVRSQALRHLQQLETEVSAEQYHAAVDRGRMIQLHEVVTELLALENNVGLSAPPVSSHASTADALTKRELEILNLMSSGMKNREIADQLMISVGTVKWYSSQILSKLHVQNRVQALAQARALNLLS
jgi:predicted ATPase/DNA-binding CsgD family transcriptional regulator